MKNKAQAPLPKLLQDFTAFNPPESALITKSPAYILFLLFYRQTILLGVFQAQTITVTPKARSSAKLLHLYSLIFISSEMLATGAIRGQTGNYSARTSLPVDGIWLLNVCF